MAEQQPKVIQVAQVPKKQLTDVDVKKESERLLATLCYFYPQYTLAAARKLPFKDVKLLLSVATKQKAADYLNLSQIAAAPHTEKGRGVKKLYDNYKKVIEENG
jgi:hypothetical protein